MSRVYHDRFTKLVEAKEKVYLSKDPGMRQYLIAKKALAKMKNRGLQSTFIPKECFTCGAENQAHPETGHCFICNTDNWAECGTTPKQ